MKQTVIKTYIRNSKTESPRGVAVAVKDGNSVRYGFSLLNQKADRFDKELGTKIAIRRAMAEVYQLPSVPERETMVLDAFRHLQSRALKYFKDLEEDNIKIFM